MGEAARRFSTRFKMRKMVQARPIRIPRPTRVIRSVGSTRGWTSSISDASSSERSSRPRATRRATFEATSSTCARNFLPCFLRCSRASKLDAAGLSGLKDTILKGIEALNQQVATAAEFAESGKNRAHDGARCTANCTAPTLPPTNFSIAMDLPMPAMFSHWDPLLQRRVRKFMLPPTPAGSSTAATPIMGRLSMSTPEPPVSGGAAGGGLMPPPPPRPAAPASAQRPTEVSTPAAAGTPSTPAELEAQSIALAYKLQQEEHAAFLQAVRVNSPSPRPAAGAVATPVEHTTPAEALQHQMMDLEEGADADDESLKLALQLQQEELQWQSLQSRRTVEQSMGGDDDDDEDVRLARLLQAQEDEAGGM